MWTWHWHLTGLPCQRKDVSCQFPWIRATPQLLGHQHPGVTSDHLSGPSHPEAGGRVTAHAMAHLDLNQTQVYPQSRYQTLSPEMQSLLHQRAQRATAARNTVVAQHRQQQMAQIAQTASAQAQSPQSTPDYYPPSHLNSTILPDKFLETWLPTFLIRHPALVFPSHYRAFKDSFSKAGGDSELEENQLTLSMTPYFTRSLFD